METIFEFFFDKVWGKAILGVALLGSLVGWFAYDQRTVGATKEVAKIQKATDHATQAIRAAAARSTNPGVRGVRDPSTRDE